MTHLPDPGRVGRGAVLLGFAGLLPALAAAALLALGRSAAAPLALGYALVILSFLGGIWWAVAMRRDAGQGRLAAAAVVPSLAAFALMIAWELGTPLPRLLVLAGTAVLLTLPVDRRLAATGEAPAGWMGLRVPLSLGLGALTILSGVLAATRP